MTNVPVSSKKFSVVRSMTALKRTLKPPGQSGGLLTGVKYEPLDTTTVSWMICGPSARAAAAAASAAIAQNKIRVIPRMVMLLSGWFGLAAGPACAAPASLGRRHVRAEPAVVPCHAVLPAGAEDQVARAVPDEPADLSEDLSRWSAWMLPWRRTQRGEGSCNCQSESAHSRARAGRHVSSSGSLVGWRVAGPAHHLLGEDQLHRKRLPFSGRNLEAALGCLFVDLLDERQPSEPVVVEQTLFDQDRHACTYGQRERVAGTSVDLLAVHEDSRVERVVTDARDRDPLDTLARRAKQVNREIGGRRSRELLVGEPCGDARALG